MIHTITRLSLSAPGDIPLPYRFVRTIAGIALFTLASPFLQVGHFPTAIHLLGKSLVLQMINSWSFNWIVWWSPELGKILPKLFQLGLLYGLIAGLGHVAFDDTNTILRNDKMALLSSVFNSNLIVAGTSLYGLLTAVNVNITLQGIQTAIRAGIINPKRLVSALSSATKILLSPLLCSDLLLQALGLHHLWPLQITMVPVALWFTIPGVATVALEAWSLVLQVHLSWLVYSRNLRENKFQMNPLDIFTTVGIPDTWFSTIEDLGRMNTLSAIQDLRAFLTGDPRTAKQEQEQNQRNAEENVLPLSLAAGGTVGLLAKATLFGGNPALAIAGVTSMAIYNTASHFLNSKYYTSRNVTFLRELNQNFEAGDLNFAKQVQWMLESVISQVLSPVALGTLAGTLGEPGDGTDPQADIDSHLLNLWEDGAGIWYDLLEVSGAESPRDYFTIVLRCLFSLYAL